MDAGKPFFCAGNKGGKMDKSKHVQENEALIKKMRDIPALKSFEDQEFKELLRLSEIKIYEPGDLVFEEGSRDQRIYYLISGKVKIVKHGKELAVLKTTGDIFGEMGGIDGSARSASVYAAEEAMCLAINLLEIEKLSVKDRLTFRYIIYREFAKVLASRLRLTTDELVRAREALDQSDPGGKLAAVTQELKSAKAEIARLKKMLREDPPPSPIL